VHTSVWGMHITLTSPWGLALPAEVPPPLSEIHPFSERSNPRVSGLSWDTPGVWSPGNVVGYLNRACVVRTVCCVSTATSSATSGDAAALIVDLDVVNFPPLPQTVTVRKTGGATEKVVVTAGRSANFTRSYTEGYPLVLEADFMVDDDNEEHVAITFALWGEGRYGDRDLGTLSAECDGMGTTLVFAVAGKTYRVSRHHHGSCVTAALYDNDLFETSMNPSHGLLAEEVVGLGTEGPQAVTVEVTSLLGMDAAGFRLSSVLNDAAFIERITDYLRRSTISEPETRRWARPSSGTSILEIANALDVDPRLVERVLERHPLFTRRVSCSCYNARTGTGMGGGCSVHPGYAPALLPEWRWRELWYLRDS